MNAKHCAVLALTALLPLTGYAALVQVSGGVMVKETWAERGENADCGAVLDISTVPDETLQDLHCGQENDELPVSFGCAAADSAAERRAANRMHQSAALAYALQRAVMARVSDTERTAAGDDRPCAADRVDVIK